ncbi:hypothetical protein B9C99_24065 [Rhodococcus sp. BUPNP1]|nr:hypothetical protein B9C99_24065 [Rhodococcus sp. BUPNP1]
MLDPHGHFTSDDDDSHGFADEPDEDDPRLLKQDDSYTFTYSFEYIAKNHGNDKYDIDTAEMVVHVEWSDANEGYVISYDVPDMDKIDPEQGNSDAKGFYDTDVYWKLTSDLDDLGITAY